MLYERWREIVARAPGETAARDVASGRQWTFAQLHAAAENNMPAGSGIVHPRSTFPEFLLDVLAAWRDGRAVCPLEPGQPAPGVPPPPAGCVHLKLTSATTSAARVVAFTADQLRADVENIVATMGLRPDWPNLGVISMPHSYGFSNLVLPLLLEGIPLIHAASPFPEVVRRAAEGQPAITLAGVPALWRAWHEAGAIPPNVQLAISAGAPLPVRLEQEVFTARKIKIHNFYGSTECGGIAYDITDSPREDDAMVGAPMKNVCVTVSDDGCMRVEGRAVGETYWPEPSDMLRDGKFQTSDLAEVKNGAVFLRGRLSDQINVAGRKISPETVERALKTHPQVREILVFGVPDTLAERAETIVAAVVSAAGEAELKAHLLSALPAWQVPREWWFVESLAANQRGKISRAEWRRRYLERPRP